MLRRWIGTRLEEGSFDGAFARKCASVYARVATPVRTLELPPGARVIGVGGPTLGGSSKTPIAAELARRLRLAGQSVAVVGHAYRARPRAARRVASEDPPELVGDDALCMARELARTGVPVFVAPKRCDALALAARTAPLIVVDALLQTRPERLGLSLLVFDRGLDLARTSCPPAGDLRAPLSDLLAGTDIVLVHRELQSDGGVQALLNKFSGITTTWTDSLEGARLPAGAWLSLDELRSVRVGLVLGIARPTRVVQALAVVGIHPAVVESFADHAAPRASRRSNAFGPDLWLTTPKCAARLPSEWRGAPLWTLERRIRLDDSVVEQALGVAPNSAAAARAPTAPRIEPPAI